MPFYLVSESSRAATRSEGVGELRDGEDALVVEFLPFLFSNTGQQTEIVLLDCFLSAKTLEFTLNAVLSQNEFGRGGCSE